ncbi:MAG: glycosyltransferase family 2 protein [Bacteroidetes bacterium]|nr:glycosyltransferase family 2 protein [Bacteroidota bacterium]
MKKKISILTACYNEEENVEELIGRVKEEFSRLPQYDYEHIFIDNASQDKTVEILKRIALEDKHIKIIVNLRNFGHIRSPFYGLMQGSGDAVISVVADLQDPPEMIPLMINKWEQGSKIVVGVKKTSKENPVMYKIRSLYYNLLYKFSDVKQIRHFTGFGLFDKSFMDILRQLDEPYPYFRGLVAEYGFEIVELEYQQPKRLHGKTKNNFFTLYDMAMNGFVNHTIIPLRMATFTGFLIGFLSLCSAIYYAVYKFLNWNSFDLGLAPLIIGLFFFSAVQLIFIGLIGEYVGAIYTQVKNRPLVIEKERINYDA